jgi:hypothetical protein
MSASTIPAAIDGLIAALKTNTQLSSVQVIDGQPTTDLPGDYVLIGFGDDSGASVSGTQTPASLGNLRRSEQYTINCEVSAWQGSTNMKIVRDRAFQILASVEDVVRSNATFGGAVMFADFGQNIDLNQIQTAQGAVAVIKFTISIKITRI